MNEIQIVYDWLINHFDSNVLTHTTSILRTKVMDQNKETIYPLVNIDFLYQSPKEQAIFFTFLITIIQQRDTIPKVTDNKLLIDTNFLDNMNETSNISVRFFNVITGQNNDYNIELVNDLKQNSLQNWGINTCDGFQFEVTLSIPNSGKSC